MKRSATFVATVLASLALTGTSLARQSNGHRHHATVTSLEPDQVLQWNQELLTLLQVPGAQPATIHPTRTLAIAQLAVYDAVNAIDGGNEPYRFRGRAPRGASANAAAAAAAHAVLRALLPSQQAAVDAAYQTSLAQVGSGPRVRHGIEVGEDAANAILGARANDGAGVTPTPFAPLPGPGEYQLTPPAFTPAGFTQTEHVTPFVITSAGQFLPSAPPALTSTRYATDFNEVKSLGELNSTTRTADQTAIGRFWGAAPIWIVWNEIADQAGPGFHNTLEQNARMLALLDTSLADGAIALYNAKYTYHRWRPITAITALDQGNLLGTIPDPYWVPLANTANDPSYPGAHADFSQAAATVLDDFFGTDNFAFSLSNAPTAITRSFQSFSQAAAEASVSRIYAGQHFRYDEDAGQTLGAQVAQFVFAHALLPQTDHHGNDHHHRDARRAAA
jgi:membrane-associated phospholipid phosphatase